MPKIGCVWILTYCMGASPNLWTTQSNNKIKFRLGNIQISNNIRISFYNTVLSLSTIDCLVVAWDSMHLSSYHKVMQIPIERWPISTMFYTLFFKYSRYFVFILTRWFQAILDRHFKDLLRQKALSKNSVFCRKYF